QPVVRGVGRFDSDQLRTRLITLLQDAPRHRNVMEPRMLLHRLRSCFGNTTSITMAAIAQPAATSWSPSNCARTATSESVNILMRAPSLVRTSLPKPFSHGAPAQPLHRE